MIILAGSSWQIQSLTLRQGLEIIIRPVLIIHRFHLEEMIHHTLFMMIAIVPPATRPRIMTIDRRSPGRGWQWPPHRRKYFSCVLMLLVH